MIVLVGSKNPGKIEGVKEAFDMFFEDVSCVGIDVDSEVNSQPVNEETMRGAKNRVKNLKIYAKQNGVSADYFVAVESGLVNIYGSDVIINACYIEDVCENSSYAFSQGFPIPSGLFEDIKNRGLSTVYDEIFSIKRDPNAPKILGGINTLTNGKISRIQISRDASIMALTKFLHKEWR